MIFRYKITPKYDEYYEYHYMVKIQKYNSRFPHWRTICDEMLRKILSELNTEAFNEVDMLWSVTPTMLLRELERYDSVESVIMKYITDVIIKREEKNNADASAQETLEKLVITNGWKTIEIKEND